MSKNIDQIFVANPAASMNSTDLYYLGRSPYGLTNDMAITWTNVMGSITAVGTVATGTWNGTVITGTYGGTGVNNGASTITIGGNLTFSGAFTTAITVTGPTTVTLPTSGTLATTTQLPSLPLTGTFGGTGMNNGSNTISLGGNISTANSFTTSGNFAVTQTYTAPTNVTFPTSGTLATTAGTIANATNVATTSTSSNASFFPLFVASSSNSNQACDLGTGLTFNPSTNTLTTTTFSGALNGNATTATTAANALTWNDVSGTTQAAAVGNGYIISNSGQTTVTLPATAAEGSVVAVQGKGAAGWILTANTGQTIKLGSSTTSSAGTLTSTNQWDAIEVICVTANTTWATRFTVSSGLTVA